MSFLGLLSGLVSAGAERRVGEIEQEAFREEAKAQELQGQIALEEAETEAERVTESDRKAQAKQRLAFLKSGVSLAGSPLLVQEEARKESAEFTESIRTRGERQFELAATKGRALRQQGRARLIGRTARATATGLTAIQRFSETQTPGALRQRFRG